ncbi:dephospho-CoA kinase [uncultured Abyssibacter sp.]|uniref:dephospho-CoA kinase n=1 Tax=uncultured Abyssibacter sp. TaxID=2320202 RepID=UPI0032B1EFC8
MIWTVGLTGGIASGKSAASAMFEALGVPVLDADQTARDVVEPGTPGLARIIETFGNEVLTADGQLDRAKLRAIVFKDNDKRQALEAIVHPAVRVAMQAWRESLDTDYCILAIPLLVESGLNRMTDRVLVIDVDPDTQRRRLIERDGIDAALAERMIQSQVGREERLAAADDVVDNNGSLAALQSQIDTLHRRYVALSHAE